MYRRRVGTRDGVIDVPEASGGRINRARVEKIASGAPAVLNLDAAYSSTVELQFIVGEESIAQNEYFAGWRADWAGAERGCGRARSAIRRRPKI